MTRLLRAEARRAAATSTTWVLLGISGLLGGLSSVLLVALADEEGAALLTDPKLQEAMHGASVGALLVVVAGCLGMAGDWRHGQSSTSFLTTPRRSRLVAARATVYAAAGAVFGLAASTAALLGAAVAYRAEDLTLPLDRSAVWLTLAGVVGASVLLGVLGVGLGAVIRSPVVAVVSVLAWFFMIEPIVLSASSAVARWLPGMASAGLGRAPEESVLAPGPAALALGAACAIAVALGARLVDRTDITT